MSFIECISFTEVGAESPVKLCFLALGSKSYPHPKGIEGKNTIKHSEGQAKGCPRVEEEEFNGSFWKHESPFLDTSSDIGSHVENAYGTSHDTTFGPKSIVSTNRSDAD